MNELLMAVLCVASGLAWAEVREWLPWMAKRIVVKAVAVLPVEERDRMLEELSAELGVVPGKVSPLIFACSVWWGFWRGALTAKFESVATQSVLRVSDIVLSSVLALLAAPMFFVTYLATSASCRTIGLRRTRYVGRNDVPFEYLQFHVHHSTTGEQTKCGALIYRLALDSLPALINVMVGEMSLVGPEPKLAVPVNRDLAHLKPGLLWCISVSVQPSHLDRRPRVMRR